jgi:3-hydroxyacyl-CoA dehydrogenase
VHPDAETRPTRSREEYAQENVRRLIDWNKQDTGLGPGLVVPRAIRSVGVVGAGTMGLAIAAAHAKHDLRVVLTDASQAALESVPARLAAELRNGAGEDDQGRAAARRIEPTSDLAAVVQCDLVVEAISETFAAKQALYAQMAGKLGAETILASNTSTIPIGRLGSTVADPSRFCGIHFCHPVAQRRLVEIVRGPKTSDTSIASVVAHAKTIDKLPILVHDGPGFLINRVLLPYLSEALDLLLEGATITAIDQAATDFGMAKGPLEMLDEIGLDVTLHGGMVLSEAFPDRIAASPVLVTMVKAGRLGRKAGAGFYGYPSPGQLSGPHAVSATYQGGPANELVGRLLAPWAKPPHQHTAHSILTRLLLPMVLEATRVLEENKVRDPRDIDLGVIFGLGFPASRGGLLWWADTLGTARIREMLRPLARLGSRAQATPLLQRMARTDRRFYQGLPTGQA